MKLQFDAQQSFQIDAVNAVVDLFDGQPLHRGDFEVSLETQEDWFFGGQMQIELGIGNNLALDTTQLLKNLQAVQVRNGLEADSALLPPVEESAADAVHFNFSVEMETGTGKTYVYLRTILELNRKYGFKKFIIVVPSIAIREGTLKNLEITKDHFKAIFNNVEYEHFDYDATKISRLRQFAVSNQVQVMVINIDAFRKNFSGTEEENKSNVIYKESDRLSGRQPIEFVRATRPIVIIDEPQSVDNTEKAQEAIKSLAPLCTLRYSATHRNPYNLVYKLDPVKAYELRLVKQIVVASVTSEGGRAGAYVKLKSVDYGSGKKPTAKIAIQTARRDGVKEKDIRIKGDEDLYELSGELAQYRDGFVITEINAEPGVEAITFNNGVRICLGQEQGGPQADIWKTQIRNTVQRHLEKEIQVKGRGIKVLSLFFIDRVANYRDYDADGHVQKGKFSHYFEEAFGELSKQDRFKGLLPHPVDQLHNGYFATDKKGILKESREGRATEADADAYNLIMKDKERLLSQEEPLRFIFSHSALREGWDNPNVFQICTLNETRSVLKKRQEIGRGLRLPVNQAGERVFDESINQLLVVANESYEEFAEKLQKEYEDDCGVTFGKVAKAAFIGLMTEGMAAGLTPEASGRLWEALKSAGYLDGTGKIQPTFQPEAPGFVLSVPPEFASVGLAVVELLKGYRLERHIKRAEDRKPLRLNKQVYLDPDFKELWDRIKFRTVYSVTYGTDELLQRAVEALKEMSKVEPIRITYTMAKVDVDHGGVTATAIRQNRNETQRPTRLPDLIEYLQNKTELTRGTLVKALIASGRLGEFLLNPQVFMDQVVAVLQRVMHTLVMKGIQYEKLNDEAYEMQRFEMDDGMMTYLSNRLEVHKGMYDAVVFDSEVEREFAQKMDTREDIKLFVKLPAWFKVETPLGTYNPDWAIVKHEDKMLYLVRETKGTLNFENLRQIEEQKIKCGAQHFQALGADYKVVVTADEI